MKSDKVWREEFVATRPSSGNCYSRWIEYKYDDRLAICTYCSRLSKSDKDLPFFKERKESPMDSFFCGCRGFN